MTAEDVAAVATAPVFRKRGKNQNLRKRAATPVKDASDDSSSSSENESGPHVKRQKRTYGIIASSKEQKTTEKDISNATIFLADRDIRLDRTKGDAVKHSNWYDGDDNTSSLQRMTTNSSGTVAAAHSGSDGTYKGLANQTSFIQKNPNAPDRKFGPMKAPTNIRTITVTDFAPDVCKDYKQTGFCGFGDNCKFLHAREDYKQGWQLDQEWDSTLKGRKGAIPGKAISSADKTRPVGDSGGADGDDEAMLDKIPFVCIICKKDYKEPVVTRCQHYFCEDCALKRHRKDPSCAACGSGTNGVFNTAKRLKKLLERKKERMEKKRQIAIEAGEYVEDEDLDVESRKQP